MKKKYTFIVKIFLFFVGGIALLQVGCTSGEYMEMGRKSPLDSSTRVAKADLSNPQDQTLELMLKRLPGVEVIGSGFNAQVKIRNSSSFMLTTEPLFVLNGLAIGHSFSSIAQNVSPADVDRIEVLKGPDATFYGARGANGVVMITLKGASR
ncbi:MAG: TonB-dependent receptor plug domain-containing protein [Bacteroidota bacterium]